MIRRRRDPVIAADLHLSYKRDWSDGTHGDRASFDDLATEPFCAVYACGYETGTRDLAQAEHDACLIYGHRPTKERT